VVVDLGERALWTPTLETAVSLLLLPRVASALLSPIADCDETFNYWEPLHFLLHGFGFQTWEYSPAYALRSYLYLGLHVVVARATQLAVWLGVSTAHAASAKLLVFYGLRGALGLACAYCEALFYRSTIPHFGRRTARYLLLLLLFNAGLFHASTALLPSSFVMYLILLVLSAWMDGRHFLGIFYGVVAVLCGWPYVGVLFLPFMVDTLLARGLGPSLLVGAAVGGAVLAAEVGVNFYYYQKLVLPAWQIVQYNVLSAETDSTLYGTEPLSFYVLNLALNFNVAAVLAVPALAMVPLLPPSSHATSWQRRLVYLSPLFIWLGIMFSQAHKEERFLSPVYPLVCLAAAITLSAAVALLQRGLRPGSAAATLLVSVLVYGTLGAYSLLSVSRVASNVINFQAPLRVYHHLAEHVLPSGATGVLHRATPPVATLCVGKEWYRFPTSFFLPSNATQVHFLQSAFRGLLPKPFEQHAHATSIVPSHMNNRNQEEPSRYVELRDCDYVVDLNLPDQQETKFWELPDQWELVYAAPFLNADASKSPFRSFYVPLLTPQFTRFADYAVYKQKRS
jgi:alpha-1,2-mannosyltransferase